MWVILLNFNRPGFNSLTLASLQKAFSHQLTSTGGNGVTQEFSPVYAFLISHRVPF